MKKKKVLFVINTLGRAGAEVALLSLFSALDPNKYDISLYVIMAQGEMADELPSYVHLRNPYFSTESVLTEDGRKDLVRTVMRKMIKNGHWFQKVSYMLQVWKQMKQTGTMLPDKILCCPMEVSALKKSLIWQLPIWRGRLPIMWQTM